MPGSSPCAQLPLLEATGNPEATWMLGPISIVVSIWQGAAAAACKILRLAACT